ncbi:formyltransferase family protein [Roseomonas sp. CAU 1739]|uniref:formyltransferase family protein n=1 Tax=Roseomonas sp. CAU 1739 TaxID=3140364 RepID=UPI00325BD4BD
MRVALCVKRDIFGVIAARRFLADLGAAADVDVFCSTKVRPAEGDVPGLRLLSTLERDVPIGTLHPAIAGDWTGAPAALRPESWEVLPDLAPAGGARTLLARRPDIVVSMRFSLIFPSRVIDAVPLGILNVHPGPLPAYRGLFAPFWQAAQGEASLSASLHLVDAGIDTGPLVAEHAVARDDGRCLLWHIAELYRGGAALAAEAVRAAAGGQRPRGRIQPEGGRYYRMPDAAAFAAFARGTMPLVSAADYLGLLAEVLLPPAPSLRAAA